MALFLDEGGGGGGGGAHHFLGKGFVSSFADVNKQMGINKNHSPWCRDLDT